MKTVFTSLVLGLAGTLWAADAQAATYRYEFDVIQTNLYFTYLNGGSFWNFETGEDLSGTQAEEDFIALYHPLHDVLGATGRVVLQVGMIDIPVSYSISSNGNFTTVTEIEPYLQINCISGFLCDGAQGLVYYSGRDNFGDTDENNIFEYSGENPTKAGFTGLGGHDWIGQFNSPVDGTSGGSLRFDGDIYGFSGVVGGVEYQTSSDAWALFQLANVRATQLHPAPVPLPASGLLLLGALGGAAALARRRAGRAQARRDMR